MQLPRWMSRMTDRLQIARQEERSRELVVKHGESMEQAFASKCRRPRDLSVYPVCPLCSQAAQADSTMINPTEGEAIRVAGFFWILLSKRSMGFFASYILFSPFHFEVPPFMEHMEPPCVWLFNPSVLLKAGVRSFQVRIALYDYTPAEGEEAGLSVWSAEFRFSQCGVPRRPR